MRVKMTKALSFLLCLLMLVNMLPVSALASEATPDEPSAQTEQQPAECQHTGGSATCKALAVCDNCKQSYGEYAAHSGGTATCTALAVCETCGEGYGALAEHSYSAGVCTACNGADPDYVPPCEHSGGTATCTALAVCETCGEGYGALAEHSYENGVCTVCNEADPDYVPPCEHTGGEASCTEQAKCDLCGAAYGELASHSYDNGVCVCGEVCAHAEYAEGKCTLCGAAQPEVACTCETDDPAYHAPFCALYERTGDACTCEVKCTEENHNIYCEVCYFDGIAACTGGEEDQIPYVTEGSCGTGVSYTLDNGVLTISGIGEMSNWGPNSAPWYNDSASINKIVISSGVTSIGNWAFYKCESLTSVTIPDSVTRIGDRAFRECSVLESVDIPDSVTSIGSAAFIGCSNLTSVNIPDSVMSIESSTFYDCKRLTSVTIPGSVTSIGNNAFKDCDSLTNVDIPSSVTSIGESAFYSCSNLKSVTIGNSVESIGDSAFYNCSNLKSVTIGNSVESIGNNAFFGCDSLTNMDIPSSVKSIGESAFYSCSNLESVTIGNSVTSIGDNAFQDCDALTSVTAPCKCRVDLQRLYDGQELLYTFDYSVTIDIAPHKAADTGAATCTKQAVCGTCGASYGELDTNNHTPAENVTYTDNGNGTHSFTCVCGTTITEAHTYGDEDGTCACGLVKTYTITLTADYTGVKIVEINGQAVELLPGGNFTVPHGQELKVKFVNTVSQKETGVHCDAWDEDWPPIDFNYDEATNTMTIPANEVNRDIFIDAYAYVSVQFNLHGGTLTDDGRELGYTWDAETATLKAGYSFNFALRPEYFQLAGHTLAGAKVDGSEEVVQQLKIRSDMTVDILWECDGTAILTPVPAKDATCMEAGNIAHYVCTCDKLYEDEAGTKELTAEEVKTDIDPTNHVGMDTATGKCACGLEMAGAKVTSTGVDTYYEILKAALADAKSGDTVTLCKSAGITDDHTIPAGVTFVGGEYSVSNVGTGMVTNNGTIASGKFDAYVQNNGTVSGGDFTDTLVNGGTVTGGSFSRIDCHSGSTLSGSFQFNLLVCFEECTMDLSNAIVDGSAISNNKNEELTAGSLNLPEGYALKLNNNVVSALSAGETGFIESHTHTYKTRNNETHHWTVCACGKTTAQEEHTYTYADNGDNHTVGCSGCNYTGTEAHTLTYTTNGSTITESCSANCGYSASLTLKAPANLVFDRTEKAATVEGEIIADYKLTYSADAVIMAGDYTATLTVGDYSVSLAFTIAKADPDVVTPSDLKATYGQTLADVELPGGWAWKNSSASVGSVGSNTFAAIYTPGNISNFNTLERDLTVVVAKAMPTVTAPVAADDLVYNGTAQTLVTAGTANGGTMQYRLSQNESFSSAISTGKNAGTYTVYYKVVGDANHNDSTEGSVTVTIAKATATVDEIPVQKHFHDYATANTLDLSQYLPADRSETTYTLDTITGSFFADGTAVTETGSLTYTTKVMEAAATGSIAVNVVMENYRDVTLTVPVELVAVTAQTETRIVKNGLTEVPAGLANTGFNTLEKLKAEQQRVLALRLGQEPQSSIAHYDVKLQFSPDGGKTWVDATEENFPADGLTVTLPYPSGTGKDSHKFVVSHMFTTGNKAGTTETPAVTKTAEGIQFTVTGLSPVSVAWSAIPFDVSIGAVTNGTVYVSPAHTTAGTQVTITVIPKSGYKLSTLTVKDAAGNSYAVSTDNNGKYYFTMPAANVTVTATFSKISTATADPTNPKTGDDFGVIFWSGMMMTSLFGMAVMVLEKKKFYQR